MHMANSAVQALVILAAAAATLAVVAPAPAEARRVAKSERCRVIDGQLYCPARRIVRRETHDDVRANSLDPAGDYKGYPSWARAALSPKSDGAFRN
jgi:hypothetical protein